MAINYPTSVDNGTTLPNPSTSSAPNNPSHAGLHDNENVAIIALENKLGTGASTPTNNNFLVGTGTGTSAWNKAVPTGTVVGTTDSQDLSNKTATSIALDTIIGKSVSTTVTIANLAIANGVLNTSNSVKTSNYQNTSVTADKLSTGAQRALISTSETTASVTPVDLATPGPSVTVTIGVNGLAIVVLSAATSNSGANLNHMYLTASGANTINANGTQEYAITGTTTTHSAYVGLLPGLSAGSTTFTAKYAVGAGTGTWAAREIAVIPL